MGVSIVELIQLKIVLFAPMPSASIRTTRKVKPGLFAIIRRP
jgi:hypothetical protein